MPRFATRPLGAPPWPCVDPFLFCVHHVDAYPRGNGAFGPAAALTGRQLGQDFAGRDGWNMYHGRSVPGFPPHPHRGFETVTVLRRGVVDHSDSLGAAARFGPGDVQWMTAGKGIVHSEMFPLLDAGAPNPLELFQIWVNLPAEDKMADPHFSMLWAETVPGIDADGVSVVLVAGAHGSAPRPPSPPPRSWASRPDAHVAIWTVRMAPGARFTLPEVPAGVVRTLYLFAGKGVRAADESLLPGTAAVARDAAPIALVNGPEPSELLLLQGRPIGEPVAQYGPFVMNTRDQIVAAFEDYQRSRFGGWPWPSDEPVHAPDAGRFARYPGWEPGRRDVPPG